MPAADTTVSAVLAPARKAEARPSRAAPALGAVPAAVFGAWTAFGLLFSFAVYWEVRSHGHSPARILAYTMLVWYWWAAVTPAVAWFGRRVPLVPVTWRHACAHAAAAIVVAVVHGTWWTLLLVWLRPFDSMGTQTFFPAGPAIIRNRLFFEVMVYAAVLGGSYVVEYQRRLREREMAALQLEASLAQARLHALELQLQPHFLFNTLHAIGGLVRQSRSQEAVEMIAGLSDLLRYSLDQAGAHVVPLGRELDVLGRYLDIQRVRLGPRLSFEIDVPPALRRAAVPAMILQPLAENAVRHGVEPLPAGGTIRLEVRRQEQLLHIELSNAAPTTRFARAGVGLRNTQARLRQLYGDRHSFTLEGGTSGVRARISIPYAEADS